MGVLLPMQSPWQRRTVLRTAGAVLVGALAGCSGDDSPATETETDQPDDTETDQPDETETEEPESQGQPSVDEFLSQTDNYDGIEDRTGVDAVEVDVGVEANGAYYGFSPPAIRIDQGTTVTWTWTGQGGIHNVVARHGGEFRSEQQSQEGFQFEQQFDEPGTVLYACVPHEGVGMKGALIVE